MSIPALGIQWQVTVTTCTRRGRTNLRSFHAFGGRWRESFIASRRQFAADRRGDWRPPSSPDSPSGTLDAVPMAHLAEGIDIPGHALVVILEALRFDQRRTIDLGDLKMIVSQLGSRITRFYRVEYAHFTQARDAVARTRHTLAAIDRVLERAAGKPPTMCPYCQAAPGIYAQHPPGPCPACGRSRRNGYELTRADARYCPTCRYPVGNASGPCDWCRGPYGPPEVRAKLNAGHNGHGHNLGAWRSGDFIDGELHYATGEILSVR